MCTVLTLQKNAREKIIDPIIRSEQNGRSVIHGVCLYLLSIQRKRRIMNAGKAVATRKMSCSLVCEEEMLGNELGRGKLRIQKNAQNIQLRTKRGWRGDLPSSFVIA